jgi:uncharacterized protein (DUF305 family)
VAAASADDAFVVRLQAQQQTTKQLLETTRERLRARAAKRLVTPMLDLRERTLGRLEPFVRKAGSVERAEDLGVSREQSGEDVPANALDGTRPLDPAFLATMARLDDGTVALAKAELARGRDPAVKELARQLIVDHRQERTRIDQALAALQQDA